MTDAGRIAEKLRERGCPMPVFSFREIDSTNGEAKRQWRDGNGGTMLFIAETQTAGRGRAGRPFYSASGAGLYFTLAFAEHALPVPTQITQAAAVAVALPTERRTGCEIGIKWVNDLLLDGKKIAGILTESAPCRGVTQYAVGVGLNLCGAVFPPELEGIAGALPVPVSEEELLTDIVAALMEFLRGEASFREAYRTRCCLLGREIEYRRNGETHRALALSLCENGALRVRHADGSEEDLFSGEVTLHREPEEKADIE